MDRRYYSKRHFERLSNGGPVSAETEAWWKRRTEAGAQASREMTERFSPITESNAGEAMKWWEARFAELMQ